MTVKNQNKLLVVLLLTSIIIIILNDFVFVEKEEIIRYGSKLGGILSNLSLAYISSFIFYYVVVEQKEKRDKKNIYLEVYKWTNQLIGRAYSVYENVVQASGVNHLDYDRKTITKEQFIELCKLANPNEIAPNKYTGPLNNLQRATYGQFIYNNSFLKVKLHTEQIFTYMRFLDTDFIKLINKLHSSTFFLVAPTFLYDSTNTNLSVYAENMFEFIEYVRELDNFNSTVNKELIKD